MLNDLTVVWQRDGHYPQDEHCRAEANRRNDQQVSHRGSAHAGHVRHGWPQSSWKVGLVTHATPWLTSSVSNQFKISRVMAFCWEFQGNLFAFRGQQKRWKLCVLCTPAKNIKLMVFVFIYRYWKHKHQKHIDLSTFNLKNKLCPNGPQWSVFRGQNVALVLHICTYVHLFELCMGPNNLRHLVNFSNVSGRWTVKFCHGWDLFTLNKSIC